MTWTRAQLIEHLAAGNEVEFLFFWGHTPKAPDRVDASCLSQWYPCSFSVDGERYASAEHFMMAGKAELLQDRAALAQILRAATPADAKALGRTVKGFDKTTWERACFEIVVRGNVAKFSQSTALGVFLRGTGSRVLVEAAPRDLVWGIGLGASNPAASDPRRWRGQNLLGFALMEARARLIAGLQGAASTSST